MKIVRRMIALGANDWDRGLYEAGFHADHSDANHARIMDLMIANGAREDSAEEGEERDEGDGGGLRRGGSSQEAAAALADCDAARR